jgi:hypothetical protein
MMPRSEAAVRTADDVRGFGYGERLPVWSWRRIVTGRVNCPVMAREFADACGDDAGDVFLTLCAFLKALAFASRRQLVIRAPDPFGVTADERQVLTLLAAAQSEDRSLFQAYLRWLAPPERRRELQIAAHALTDAFKMNNLPSRCRRRPRPTAVSGLARSLERRMSAGATVVRGAAKDRAASSAIAPAAVRCHPRCRAEPSRPRWLQLSFGSSVRLKRVDRGAGLSCRLQRPL